jgi:copper chaperone CopZ
MVSSAGRPGVLSLTPGRVRLHLPGWTAGNVQQIETALCQVRGVESVQANPLTGNVLVRFDRQTIDETTLMTALHEAWRQYLAAQQRGEGPGLEAPAGHGIAHPRARGPSRSALFRVGLRALLGHAVVDSLWFGAGFLGSAFGLPLAGLGPLHLVMDVVVLGWALGSSTSPYRSPTTGTRPVPVAQRQGHRDPRCINRLPHAPGV